MSVVDLLAALHRLDVRLALDGEALRFSAPPGVMTPDMRAALVERKAEVIQFLRQAQEQSRATAAIPPAPRDGATALSLAQERMWRRMRDLPPGALANKLVAVRLAGPLDQGALAHGLGALVGRHEILRAALRVVDGRPVAAFDSEPRIDLAPSDLARRAPHDQDDALRQAVAAELETPIDAERGPLIRARLLRMGADDHALIVAVHPIAWDGWSRGVFVRDLAALYRARRDTGPDDLPDLPIQYADYAIWQRGWLQGDALDRLLRYWTARLAGAPASLDLPYDRPRLAAPRCRGGEHAFEIDAELRDAAMALGRARGATLHVVLLATFLALLRSYGGQDEIVIGLPVTNRPRPETRDLIGLFVNTLALRADLSGDPSFGELVARLHDATAGAYAHQDLPLGSLIDALQTDPGAQRRPLFRVMFDLADSPLPSQDLAGLRVGALPLGAPRAEHDLWLSIDQRPGGLHATLIYDADLFDAPTIERMAQRYLVVLRAAVRDPQRRLSALTAAALRPGAIPFK